MNLKALADAKRYGKGTSESAKRRRAERERGTALTGKPGDIILDSHGDPCYSVQPDGSFRRIC